MDNNAYIFDPAWSRLSVEPAELLEIAKTVRYFDSYWAAVSQLSLEQWFPTGVHRPPGSTEIF